MRLTSAAAESLLPLSLLPLALLALALPPPPNMSEPPNSDSDTATTSSLGQLTEIQVPHTLSLDYLSTAVLHAPGGGQVCE